MADMLQIVGKLQTAVHAGGVPQNELAEYAREYVRLADEVNGRLSDCLRWLRAGFRSEAIRRAEMEPNLLEAFGVLDFPDRNVWAEYARGLGLLVAGPLLGDAAAELNEAYLHEHSIAPLMRQLRKQALTRRPVAERLATLRLIAAADSLSTCWYDDVGVCEAVVRDELIRHVETAVAKGDDDALAALAESLQSPEWLHPPAAHHIAAAADAAQRIRQARAVELLRATVRKLYGAIQQSDLTGAETLEATGRGLVSQHQIAVDSAEVVSLTNSVSAIALLRQRLQRQQWAAGELSRLDQALATHRPLDEVSDIRRELARNAVELPPDLGDRLNAYLARHNAESRRYLRWVIGLSLAMAALVATGVGYGIWSSSRAATTQQHATVLKDFLAKQQYEQADVYLKKLQESDPGLLLRPEMQSLHTEATVALDAEAARRKRFADLLAASSGDDLRLAKTSVTNASEIARTAPERTELASAKALVQERERKALRDAEVGARAEVETLRQRLLGVAAPGRPVAERQTDLETVRAQIDTIASANASASPALREALAAARNAASAEAGRLDSELRDLDVSQALSQAVGKAPRFLKTLQSEAGAETIPPAFADFQQVIKAAEPWTALSDWAERRPDWALRDGQLTAKTVADRVAAAEMLLKRLPEGPIATALGDSVAAWKSAAARSAGAGSPARGCLALLDDWVLASLFEVRLKDGRVFYTEKLVSLERVNTTKPARIDYYVDTNRTSTKNIPIAEIASTGPAAQTAVAELLREKLASVDGVGRAGGKPLGDLAWERTFLSCLETIANADEVDPVLRVHLLREFIAAGSTGSSPFAVVIGDVSRHLQATEVKLELAWLDPESEAGTANRKTANAVIALLPKWPTDEALAAAAVVYQTPPLAFEWRSWLDRRGDEWTVAGDMALSNGPIYVVRRIGEVWRLEPLGDVNGETRVVALKSGAVALRGSPVFFPSAGTD